MILFSLFELPTYFNTSELREWIKTYLIKALSVKCESFIGCSIYNIFILIFSIFENSTEEDIKNKLLQTREALNLIISRAHIADMPIIDAVNKYYDLLLPVLTNNSSDNDEIKLLEKTIEWGENNIRQQKALIAIDRIDIISEKFEKDFLSNYLNEDMKAVLRAFKSVNCETCSMDELNEAWGFMTDFMENPGCNMIGAYKRTSTALDEFRKNRGLDFILPRGFKKLMKAYATYMYFFFGQKNLDIPETDLEDEDYITGRYDHSDGWASNENLKRMNAGYLFDDFCKLLDTGYKATEYYLRYFEMLNLIMSIWQ